MPSITKVKVFVSALQYLTLKVDEKTLGVTTGVSEVGSSQMHTANGFFSIGRDPFPKKTLSQDDVPPFVTGIPFGAVGW